MNRAAILASALLACLAAPVVGAGAAPLPPQIHTVASGIGKARSVAALPDGGFLYVDALNDLVREVSPSGNVTTVAGDGNTADGPDGTLAVNSGLDDPVAVAPLSGGGFLVTEFAGCVVRRVSPGTPSTATITTIAGTEKSPPSCGHNTQSGTATSIPLDFPTDAVPLPDGSVLIADTYNDVIREVSPSGMMSNIAGSGSCDDSASSCDGMPAGDVGLDLPDSISLLPGGSGGYLISEAGSSAIREVSQVSASGTFTTVAGTPGAPGFGGDGGPATSAQLNDPEQVASTADGGFLIADTGNEVIRDVSPAGTITTVAGTPDVASYAGDGGDATAADLDSPSGVSPVPGGGFLIADEDNGAIREVTIPPVSTIALSPSTPNGNNGWYISPVTATVTTTEGAQINCELDPPAAPPAFGAIPAGCPFTGPGGQVTGDGPHTLYASSQNSFGDQEVPVSMSLKIDTTPPTVTCNSPPSFLIGTPNAVVTGTLADQVSGPASAQISAVAPTSTLGKRSVTLSGADQAGNFASVTCNYTVLLLSLKPEPSLSWKFAIKAHRTRVDRLVVRHVPAHAAVNLTCRGKGCPFAAAPNISGNKCHGTPCRGQPPSREGARAAVDLAALFTRVKIAAGAKLTVSVTAKNTVGREWVFTVRSHNTPTARAACLRPGLSVPTTSCSTS